MNVRLICIAASVGSLIWFAEMAAAQAPPPPPASPTLWSFLGIPQACYKINAQLFNRRGNHPGLEKKPPLKGIADPANLKSDVPAIKAAAEIKQAEDLKPQKIKAIKYLATIGCGCYDKDKKVTKALLAAMDDCTEDVRLAAVQAISTAAAGEYCSQCKERSCCNEEIVAQLSKIAYDHDDEGCFVEPSERVREAAVEAMGICCAGQAGPIAPPTPAPVEGSEAPRPVEGSGTSDMPPEPPQPPKPLIDTAETGTSADPSEITPVDQSVLRLTSSRRRAQLAGMGNSYQPNQSDGFISDQAGRSNHDAGGIAAKASSSSYSQRAVAPVLKKVTGSVQSVNLPAGVVQLRLHQGETLPSGSSVKVFHQTITGGQDVAVLKVIESRPGAAYARPLSTTRSPKIARGDSLEGWR
jgi:hypothetical protein